MMSYCEVVTSHGFLGQVWCLIVSIPDLYPLSYFQNTAADGTADNIVVNGKVLFSIYM